MRSRFMIVLLSLVFAAIATVGVTFYIAKLQTSVTEGQKLVDVVVARKTVAAGSSVAGMLTNGSIATVKVPRQYVADGALTSTDGYANRVLSTPLAKGEQLTEGKFKKPDEAGFAYRVPNDMLALSIAIDEITGVGGRLQPGDRVDVLATFSPGPNEKEMTKIMLQNVEVLATSTSPGDKNESILKGQPSSMSKKTVTLAVSPIHAEKLVFAAEKGRIWLGLRRPGRDGQAKTDGQTVLTVFN